MCRNLSGVDGLSVVDRLLLFVDGYYLELRVTCGGRGRGRERERERERELEEGKERKKGWYKNMKLLSNVLA